MISLQRVKTNRSKLENICMHGNRLYNTQNFVVGIMLMVPFYIDLGGLQSVFSCIAIAAVLYF